MIHPAALYRPLIVGVVVTLLVTLVLSALCRNRDLGALAAMAIVLWVVAAAVPAATLVLLPAAVSSLPSAWPSARPWPIGERVTRLMSAVAAVVALAVVISMLQSGALGRAATEIAGDAEGRGPVGVAAAGAPDIYVILLDGYPGPKARALDPSYPASELAARLRERGFDMAPVTHSNYLQTSTTVTSLFQMRHLAGLPELAPPWGTEPEDVQRLRMLLNDAPALDALRGLGYRSVATASGFAEVELRRVDRLVEPPQPNEFEVSLVRGTGLGRIVQAVAPDLFPGLQRDRILTSFADLRALAAEPHDGPRFVFAHLPAPHPPWVFGPNGEPRRESVYTFYNDSARDRQVDRITAFRQALDQARYTDGLVVEAIDAIRDASAITARHRRVLGPWDRHRLRPSPSAGLGPGRTDEQHPRGLDARPPGPVRRAGDAGQHRADAAARVLRPADPAERRLGLGLARLQARLRPPAPARALTDPIRAKPFRRRLPRTGMVDDR